jgi:uncharacterized membrane protein
MPEHADTTIKQDKSRVEALTDGIFAFAMTLLVTSLILPRSAIVTQTSYQALLSLIPDFYHYIIAFFVLAAFWMAHHRQFSQIRALDRIIIGTTVISLFLVTLVPFSTSFIGDYFDPFSSIVFEANLLVLGLVFTFQWYHATKDHRLVSPDLSLGVIRRGLAFGCIIPVISFLGILLALTGNDSSTAIYLALPLAKPVVGHLLQT